MLKLIVLALGLVAFVKDFIFLFQHPSSQKTEINVPGTLLLIYGPCGDGLSQ